MRALVDIDVSGGWVALNEAQARQLDPVWPGDVLAVVETCKTCRQVEKRTDFLLGRDFDCSEYDMAPTGAVRRGFVRVAEVLAVVEEAWGDGRLDEPSVIARVWTHDGWVWGVCSPDDFEPMSPDACTAYTYAESVGAAYTDDAWPCRRCGHAQRHHPPPSPGDVVLRVEPWCDTCRGVRHLGPATYSPQRDYGRACPDCKPRPVTVTGDGPIRTVDDGNLIP